VRSAIVIAWLKLLRLPNVFTAVADVMMGYIVTHGDLQPVNHFALLVATSCLLYLSGMVLNDVFDADTDARERSERPIPSGAIGLQAAGVVGWGMLGAGISFGWLASAITADWRPGAVATVLAASILLYDSVLKRTPTAPLLMGACRMLNVLLGMSLSPLVADATGRTPWGWSGAHWLIAAGIGLYVIGVTIFARTEARGSSRGRLVTGLLVLLAGMALLAAVPELTRHRPGLVVSTNGWYLLWGVLALITARRCVLAIAEPAPARVQAAVRHCVHSIIVLDAGVCVGYAGPFWGLAVLVLLFPTLLLTLGLDAT
jgi:4-hydroxybenzoate polyprenyltransferase